MHSAKEFQDIIYKLLHQPKLKKRVRQSDSLVVLMDYSQHHKSKHLMRRMSQLKRHFQFRKSVETVEMQ